MELPTGYKVMKLIQMDGYLIVTREDGLRYTAIWRDGKLFLLNKIA